MGIYKLDKDWLGWGKPTDVRGTKEKKAKLISAPPTSTVESAIYRHISCSSKMNTIEKQITDIDTNEVNISSTKTCDGFC